MGTEARTLVQFGVLGPLEASRDGEVVRLGGERQRALLALLLVHVNELVSMERLVEQLFGGEPSDSATNAVHVAVSRLRRALQSDDEGLLSTRPGGYLLALTPEQLDATQFQQLLDEGRQLLAVGDPARAAVRLRAALALWRGPPLADLALLEFLRPEVQRLDELRLLAMMERIDAELALGNHAELIPEIKMLAASEPLRERLRGQLMLALYRCGRHPEALAVYRETSELLREELGLEPTRALQELERMILQQDSSLTASRTTQPGANAGKNAVCPFKGLASFDTADAEYFCGREQLVSDLVARLSESTLVGILGPSGIGKSSLLRAGVLPALRAGALPRSAGWRQVVLRPAEHPCQELEGALGGEGLDEVLARLSPGERIVVAVDQLEELFTVCDRDDERSEFLERLAGASRDPERRVLILCALRADFYGRLASDQRFAALLSHSHVLVGPMDRSELTQAIEQPASRAGLVIERPLVDALVAEVVGEPGGLPLLSTTLLELWLARDGQILRFDSYRTSGGVRGAVGRLAESAYARLTEPEQSVARTVMLRLASGDEGALARRRVPLAELQQLDDGERVLATLTDARLLTVGDGEVELSHEALLREWPRYRIWLDEDRIGRRLHGHLVAAAREWDLRARDPGELYRGARLANALGWAEQNGERLNSLEREFIDVSRLEANHDAQRQRSQHRRLRSLRLAAGVLLLVAAFAGAFALVKQRSASNASRAAAADARAALGQQLSAEAGSEPRLDLAMLLAREAVNLNRSQQTEGTLLRTLLHSPAVIGSFTLPTSSPGQLAISPDGRTLAVSDPAADQVSFYDTATHAARQAPLTDFTGNEAPAYSSDGALLVYPAEQGNLQLLAVRDARTQALLNDLQFDPRFSTEVTADIPDGSIVIASDRRTVYYAYWIITAAGHPAGAYLDRWSLPSGRLVSTTRIGSGPLLALRLTDAGARMLVVSAHDVSWFDLHSLSLLRSEPITPAPTRPSAAAISPKGRAITIGSQTGSVSFVNPRTGAARAALGAHRAALAGVFYSHDGRTVAAVSDDNTVTVWDPNTARPTEELTGPTGQVQSAAASPDGTTLYTFSLDGDLLVWDLTGDRQFGRQARLGAGLRCCSPLSPRTPPLAVSPDGSQFAVRLGASAVGVFSTQTLRRQTTFTIKPRGDGITALAWSPAAPLVAVAGHSGFVQVWSVAGTPRLVRSLVGLHTPVGRPEAIQALAFSPDGSLLAASDQTETRSTLNIRAVGAAFLAVWRARTGTLIGPPRELEVGSPPSGSDALAFSPGGKLLAASLPNGRVLVLDATTGQIRQTLSPSSGSTSLAFAPDGALATGTIAGTVELWDSTTGQRIAPALIAASAPITSLTFDPGGQRFATTGYGDGTVKLWFTSTLQQEGPGLSVDPGATSTAAFELGGRGLLAVEDRGTAFSWPTSLSAWEHRACAVAGRSLSRQEWDRLVAEPRYTAICP
jgi:WD40 repeat protein/DNA-binding SARP family transcriptional activator